MGDEAATPLFMVTFGEPTRLMRDAGTIGQDCLFRLVPSSSCVALQGGHARCAREQFSLVSDGI